MFKYTESWFRTDADGHVDHVMFDVIEGRYVQVEIGVWREILSVLGFEQEIVAGEVLDVRDET